MKAPNLPTFYNFKTQGNQIFVLSLQKIMGGHESGGGAKLGGLCPPGPGLKPPLRITGHTRMSLCLSVCLRVRSSVMYEFLTQERNCCKLFTEQN